MSVLEQSRRPSPRSVSSESAAAEVGASAAPREVPDIALVFAIGMWLWLTAWVSRLLVPLFGLSLWSEGPWVLDLWVEGHAFALASAALVLGVGVTRPRVSADVPVSRGRFLAATVGGFGAWALVQGLLFEPIVTLPWSVAGPILASHVVEAVMLGSLFASVARRPAAAFALGAGFQLAVLGITSLGLLAV
ncbi:MAG: hypothetical protein AAF211_01645 [Myxococcota bacterium]